MSHPYKKNKGGPGKKPTNTPCKFFQRGNCSNNRCPYLHVRGSNAPGGGSNGSSGGGDKGAAGTTGVIATMLKLFFEKQQSAIFDSQRGLLNLSGLLSRYEDLKEVATSVNFNTRTFSVALCTCIRNLIVPPPQILCLDDNNITSTHHLCVALVEADIHLAIKCISFKDNQIKSTDVAQELKEFKNLIEVNLVGNPVTELSEYKPRFKKYLPSLLGLDGMSLVAAPLQLPWPRFISTSSIDADGNANNPESVLDATQQNIWQFVKTQLIDPLERDPSSGVLAGVDAVSDSYGLHSVLTLCLSCPEAAVTTPKPGSAGNSAAAAQRNVVREIVGFRLRQTEGNHNVLLGVKSSQVAVGRTKVCAQLEHWLYPRNFSTSHYISGSPNVVVLDNNGLGPNPSVVMKVPISVVTMHGVMIWLNNTVGGAGSSTSRSDVSSMRGSVVIKRNFARTLTVSTGDAGRWQVINDMVTLYPFVDAGTDSASAGTTEENWLLRDVRPYNVIFTPASDPNRATRLGRKFRVPETVVSTLCRYVGHDMELFTILADLGGVPIETFESCAAMVDMNPLASVFLCRLGNKFGVEPSVGVQMLRQFGFNWVELEQAAMAAQQQQ